MRVSNPMLQRLLSMKLDLAYKCHCGIYKSYISPELKLKKHKVIYVVTLDKKRDNNNDIQRSEEEDNKQQQ